MFSVGVFVLKWTQTQDAQRGNRNKQQLKENPRKVNNPHGGNMQDENRTDEPTNVHVPPELLE